MNHNRYDRRLMEKIMMIHWLMHRQQLSRSRENRPFTDTSRGQGRIIAILKMQREISTKDLAYILGIRKQSLNETLNKLEKAGYIERFASEQDRRVVMVRLTDLGEQVEQPSEIPEQADAFFCLNEEEKRQFENMLDRIIEHMSRQSDMDPDEIHARMEGASRMMEHIRRNRTDSRFYGRKERDFS